MNEMKIFSIGKIENNNKRICIKLKEEYSKGLLGLEGYSHVQVIWWADKCDNAIDRSTIIEDKPYKKGPAILGVFALRSPERPNPICVSNCDIAYIDIRNGIVGLYYIDVFEGTEVIDIKPYTPSIDRINNPKVPDWCNHWPKSYEESATYVWESEFNF